MSARHGLHATSHRTTSQLLVALLTANLLAILCVLAFHPFSGPAGFDQESSLVLTVGVMSLVATGLLFLASAMQRDATPWRVVALALNVTQIGRLIPAVIAIGAWARAGEWAGLVWAILFVPFLGVLSAVGLVMTVSEVRRGRRRRLVRAA
jgi:hypothetical protein